MSKISRRKFITGGAKAGGLILASGLIPSYTHAMQRKNLTSGNNLDVSPYDLQSILFKSRDLIRKSPDTVCLERAKFLTEAYQIYQNEPTPILRALAFNHVLQNMTLDLHTHPVFAGNTTSKPRAWMTFPEDGFSVPGQAVIENPGLEGLFNDDVIPDEIRSFWKGKPVTPPTGHLIIDNKMLVEKGLLYIIQKANEPAKDDEIDIYRKACAISCQAVIDWAERYAVAAEQEMRRTSDPIISRLYKQISETCRQVPAGPARNLYEALQSIAIVHLAMHFEGHRYSVSPGRLDQILLPFYKQENNIMELLAAFMFSLYSNSVYGSHSKTQTITIGGVNERGEDQCNELTLEILKAFDLIKLNEPLIFLRWHENIASDIKQKAISMLLAGMAMPLLVGDEQTAKGLINIGVRERDAWNYAVLGCNELGIPGKMIFQVTSFNEVTPLRKALLDSGDSSFNSVNDIILSTIGYAKTGFRSNIMNSIEYRATQAQAYPTPFTSSLMDQCLESGTDLALKTEYPFLNLRSIGFTNLVNSLAAIDWVVFQKRQASLEEIKNAIENNYEDEDLLRKKLLDAPKWGNDNEYVDNFALDWLKYRRQILTELESELDCPKLIEELVVRSLHHVDGKNIGATPDGRYAGSPVCDSVGAQQGTQKEGPTALLNSVCKMNPAIYWPGGYNLNITFPLLKSKDEVLSEKIRILVDTFFSNGGQELQINSLDEAMLLDAISNPEKYPFLMVRIAGFNGYFTELSEVEQLEMTQRARSCSF